MKKIAFILALMVSAVQAANFYANSAEPPLKYCTGTAQIPYSVNTLILDETTDTTGTTPATDAFNNMGVFITGGTSTPIGQERRITDYDGLVCTISSAWSVEPDATTTYKIVYGCDLNNGTAATWSSGVIGPERTIGAALGDTSTGDHILVADGTYAEGARLSFGGGLTNKTITVTAATDGGVVVTGTTMDNAIAISGTTCTLNLRGITASGNYSASVISCSSASATVNLTNCSFTGTNAGAGLNAAQCSAGSSMTIVGGTYTSASAGGCIYKTGAGTLSVTGATVVDPENTMIGISAGSSTTALIVDNVTFDLAHAGSFAVGLNGATNAYVGRVEIRNCVGGTYGQFWRVGSYVRDLWIEGNTIAGTYAGSGVYCGVETVDDADTESNANPYSTVRVENNTFTPPATATHVLFMGLGVPGAIIRNNTIIAPVAIDDPSTAFGIVIKSDDAKVTGNRLYYVNSGTGVTTGMYLSGGLRGLFEHNTIYTSGTAMAVDVHQDYGDSGGTTGAPIGGVVRDNIIYSTDGLALSVDPNDDTNPELWQLEIDHNLYWTGGTNVWDVAGSAALSKAALVADSSLMSAGWLAEMPASISRENDTASLCGDPRLVNPATGDFRVYTNSPALKAGSVTNMAIGSEQQAILPAGTRRQRIEY